MGLSNGSIMPTIAVDDLGRAMRFYGEKLGLSVRQLSDDPNSALVELGDSGRLLLYRSTYGRGDTTYASFMVDDLEGCVRELRDKGVQFEEYDLPDLKTENGIATFGDMKTSWFKDSEGNTLAISNEPAEVMRRAA